MKISTLRTDPHALFSAEGVLIDIAEALETWRNAVCTTNSEHWHMAERDDTRCFGDNHADTCPVERARQELLACDLARVALE